MISEQIETDPSNIGGRTSTGPRSALADARQVALRERGGRGEAAPARGSRLVEMAMMVMKLMVVVLMMMMMIVKRGEGEAKLLLPEVPGPPVY